MVVQVDNRSATAISKGFREHDAQHAGEAETPDFVAAVRWLKKQPWVDGSRVGVWGWSYGGNDDAQSDDQVGRRISRRASQSPR